MTLATTPRFTVPEAERIGQLEYGLAATATALPSERDQNFLLATARGERFVLKLAKSDEERTVLDFQNAALDWVAVRAPALAVPRLRPTLAGAGLTRVRDHAGREHYARLIGWLEGAMYADCAPHDEPLLASLGAVLGELDRALQGFAHPAMHRPLNWNVSCADLALEHLPLLSPEQQALVRGFMQAWSRLDWSALRHGVIHGDANDHNVLVRDRRVVGLIDFGDMVYSAIACDPAIAMAYAMMSRPRPLEVAVSVTRAYHERFPLTAAEIYALYPLLTARLCMSVCYAAYNARAKSGDAYQQVSAAPAWELLRQLATVTPEAAGAQLRAACE
jgi:Ser/Thr protein kinase RdoA (MazF antagonist)